MTRGGVMRVYGALLRLYPASFRTEYRKEMCAVFGESVRDVAGPLAPLRIVLAAVADIVPNAIAVHGDLLRQDLGYAARSFRRAPGFAVTAVLVVALGVGLAYPAARAMGALLAGVRPEDPVTIAGAAALCFATAVIGCLRPAIRVVRVDPMTALRAD